ncbi:efflux RND transporter periplasmic adaptor subunit [Galbibacter sp. BG1]|uniref:efflux RND transporter periplasmic adaptor subunit n=1 Tax=Galbibacter sp. BG1 TaxID=1170699 RepID=UPI0015BD2ED3|nr:efflux RND transporter periplasmic adaptor subunit [Galbibacter sp. BG1]QLE01534.1 efflux RND transporter periplasmic adaptor subunit [Galbibacter sp. BG1]
MVLKKQLLSTLCVALRLLLIVFFVGCNSKETASEKNNPPEIKVLPLQTDTQPVVISLSGNAEGSKTLRLGFMVAGRVNYVAINEGESINKGELLASLDATDYEIGLEAANGKLMEVQDKYDRLKIMYDRNSISEADFVEVKAGLQQAKAQQKLIAKNVENTKIYAPISGVLLKKGVSEGEIIDKGMPVFGLSDIDEVKIVATVPENEVNKIKMGEKAEITVYALDTVVQGEIIEIGKAAEATTRTYTAKINIENPDHRILPGMIADIKINTPSEQEILTISGNTILKDPDNNSYVFVLDEYKNKVFRRDISIGSLYGDKIQITSGLKKGDLLVTEGHRDLQDGMLVTTNR